MPMSLQRPSSSTYLRIIVALIAWAVWIVNSIYRTTLIDGIETYDSYQPPSIHIAGKEVADTLQHELINANYTEFCGDCRFSPTQFGRTTCSDRAQYLTERYKTPEQAAINAILDAQPDKCKIVRYNATNKLLQELQDGEEIDDPSMFRVRPCPESILSSPFSNNLSIYIYDTIPDKIGSHVEETMTKRCASGNISSDFMADIAIINLFRTYPGRTYDPQSAHLFVVPYPHGSHCLLESISTPWQNECMHVSGDMIQKEVFDNLPYYRGNESRHLFINTMDYSLVHPSIRDVPLSLNLGPRHQSKTAKHILIPYLNDKESFQPSFTKRLDTGWWTRPRKLSLAYFFGSANKRMPNSQRLQRLYFLEEVRTNWTASPLLGDLPYVVTTFQKGSIPRGGFFEKIYRSSIFCPTLPGKIYN